MLYLVCVIGGAAVQCTACRSVIASARPDTVFRHPVLNVLICKVVNICHKNLIFMFALNVYKYLYRCIYASNSCILNLVSLEYLLNYSVNALLHAVFSL